MTALRVTNYPRKVHTVPSAIVQAIVNRVHERGYTYKSLADNLGLDEGHVRRILQGRCSPRIDLVEGMARAVGLRILVG